MNELVKITLLTALPEKTAYPVGKIWRSIVSLHQPFEPPIHQGELLPCLASLESKGWVTRAGKYWSRPPAGTVELEDMILSMQEPWTPHKLFLLMAVGFFRVAGTLTLSPPATQFILEKMVLANNLKPKVDLFGEG